VIINQQLAKLLWGTTDVVGRRVFLFNTRGDSIEVAGVVGTSKYHTIREEPAPLVYIYYTQLSEPLMSLVVRTEGEPKALAGAVRNEVRALDPDLPAFNIRTLEDQLATAMFSERVAALLSTALAVLALIQALVGLYGVLAYSVSQRTREIGLRMALGAQPREIRRLVVGHAMQLTSTGLLAGLVGSWLAARLIATFLFGVSAADPATYVGIALAVIVFGLLASYLPLRRAFRVNPLIALKDE
jgi:putative ABC transport system permease protein